MQSPQLTLVRRQAAAVIRVSRVGKRAVERFISPEDQLKQIEALCTRQGFSIVQVFYELDQSGYRTKFEKRRGLYPATEMIENGQADVVVMAFFDRMARNIIVQTEFLGRVGRAGGEVWAADWGQIQTESAAADLSTGMLGLVTQFMARQTAEKTQGPKERAIGLGIPTFPHIPAGYRQDPATRCLVVMPEEAAIVRELFERRLGGASYRALRDWARSQGLVRSTHTIQEILRNRIYLGELRFGRPKQKGGSGELVNIHAHQPIVDRELFESVVRMRVRRGTREMVSKWPCLLARMGILRCANCGRAMIIGTHRGRPQGRVYPNYRCPAMGDCKQRVAISALVLDQLVADYVKHVNEQGTYSSGEQIAQAEATVERTGAALKRAIRNLATVEDTLEAQEVLAEIRAEHEAAQDRLADLCRSVGPATILSATDWERLSLSGRRDLVRALIKRIEVGSGRDTSRVDIQPFLE